MNVWVMPLGSPYREYFQLHGIAWAEALGGTFRGALVTDDVGPGPHFLLACADLPLIPREGPTIAWLAEPDANHGVEVEAALRDGGVEILTPYTRRRRDGTHFFHAYTHPFLQADNATVDKQCYMVGAATKTRRRLLRSVGSWLRWDTYASYRQVLARTAGAPYALIVPSSEEEIFYPLRAIEALANGARPLAPSWMMDYCDPGLAPHVGWYTTIRDVPAAMAGIPPVGTVERDGIRGRYDLHGLIAAHDVLQGILEGVA